VPLVPLVGLAALASPRARADAPGPATTAPATFALVIGVNASPEPDLPPLQFADDDAARYLDLFRALGARAYLLSRLDDNTRRLHAQAAAEAIAPRRAELERTVAALARDVAQAKDRGVPTILYVVYAGHGTVLGATPYLTLEDARLRGDELLAAVARVGADRSHVVVDACQAYLLAFGRGPGGERRPLRGFLSPDAAARARDGNIGLLLASSSSGESHEWAGFQAGVFSHEVRSGLYGAADADGDGLVSYAEIAAFVGRANQTIANDRFRPQVLAHPPRDGSVLIDLRGTRGRELRLDGAESAGHYLLEDQRGVRLLDFHRAGGAAVRLARPVAAGPLYLRRVADGAERTVPPSDAPVQLDALPVEPARASGRGAAHEAFDQLFALAFQPDDVGAYRAHEADAEARLEAQERRAVDVASRARRRRVLGWSSAGAALAAAVGAGAAFVSAHDLASSAPELEAQRDAVARNGDIDTRNRLGGALVGVSAALVGVAVYLLWPRGNP
jgi:hypothetical protein